MCILILFGSSRFAVRLRLTFDNNSEPTNTYTHTHTQNCTYDKQYPN